MKYIILCLALVLSFSVNANPNEQKVYPGDVIEVTIHQNPDLNTKTRVSEDGRIIFPLIGAINVAGLTPFEASNFIASNLKREGFLRNPQVNLIVLESKVKTVTVLGGVSKPGKYAIDLGARNLVDIISLAGGLRGESSKDIIVIKQVNGKPERFFYNLDEILSDSNLDLLSSGELDLQVGDIVYVTNAPLFYIYGEVKRPGVYPMDGEMSVSQALAIGGGITQIGSKSGFIVKRKNELGKIEEVDVTESDLLEANDVLYIKESIF